MSKVRKVSLAKLDEFFSAIAHSERLYLPVVLPQARNTRNGPREPSGRTR